MAKKEKKVEEPEKLEVTRGAVRLLTQCLKQPGWAKEPTTLYRAGKFGCMLEDKFTDELPEGTPEEVRQNQNVIKAYLGEDVIDAHA